MEFTMAKTLKHNPEHITSYRAKSGATQYRPSVAYGMSLAALDHGFCLACGNDQPGVEPDARKYTCDHCDADKVYGIEELALMGLLF
jgi:hypothetical protein